MCTYSASVLTIVALACARATAFAGEPSANEKKASAMRALRQPEELEQLAHLRAVTAPSGIEESRARLAYVEGHNVHRFDAEFLRQHEDDGQRRQAVATLDAAQMRLRDLAGPSERLLRHARFLAQRADTRAEAATKRGRAGAGRHCAATLPSGSRGVIALKATALDNRALGHRRRRE